MSGQIRSLHGFSIQPKGDGQLVVTRLSRHSNPNQPNCFIWTNAKNQVDLDRVLEALARGSFSMLDKASNAGLADHIDFPGTPDRDAPQGRVLLRHSVSRLASVALGKELLDVPSGGILTLRTNRNGCMLPDLVEELVTTGILSPEEVSAKSGPASPLDQHLPAGVEVQAPERHWMAGVTEPLWETGGQRFFLDGFAFRKHPTVPGVWMAQSLMPLDDDQPCGFRWHRPPDERLTAFLAAIYDHSTLDMNGAVRTKLVSHLRYPQSQEDDWVTISPTRLRAVLRGEDPLQFRARPGCLTLHVYRHRCVPTVIPVCLVSTRMDGWHQAALRARAAAYLPQQAQRPARHVADCVIREPAHCSGASGQAPRRRVRLIVTPADPHVFWQRSGGQLLMDSAIGHWEDRMAWARGGRPSTYAAIPQHTTMLKNGPMMMTHASVDPRGPGSYVRTACYKGKVIDTRIWFASQPGWQIQMQNRTAMLLASIESATNMDEICNEPPGKLGITDLTG
jgi:hypothetical protein